MPMVLRGPIIPTMVAVFSSAAVSKKSATTPMVKSRVLLSSPTATIWTISGGNRLMRLIGSDKPSPRRSRSLTLFRASRNTIFGVAWGSISIVSCNFSPVPIITDRVRAKRPNSDIRAGGPRIGILSRAWSRIRLPVGCFVIHTNKAPNAAPATII